MKNFKEYIKNALSKTNKVYIKGAVQLSPEEAREDELERKLYDPELSRHLGDYFRHSRAARHYAKSAQYANEQRPDLINPYAAARDKSLAAARYSYEHANRRMRELVPDISDEEIRDVHQDNYISRKYKLENPHG